MADRRIVVQITGDSRQLERAFNRSAKSAQSFNAQMAGISKNLKTGLAAGGLAIGASEVGRALRSSVKDASNLEEQMGKTNEVFGASAQGVVDWSKTTTEAFAISQRQALETASTFGALFTPIGIVGEEAAKQSQLLTELGADLASFYNTDVASALDAIRSGLVGESEPLRRYGVQLSEIRVQAVAMAQSGKSVASALTTQEKALARITIIMSDTTKAQGDSARSAERYAFQTKRLQANIEDLSARIGGTLIPVLTGAATVANKLFTTLERDIAFGLDAGELFGWASGWKIIALALDEVTGSANAARAALAGLPGLTGPVGAGGPPGLVGPVGVGAEQDARSQRKRFDALVKGLGLKADKARLTATLADDIAVAGELERAIQRQIRVEGKTFDLVEALTQARLARQGHVQTSAAAASAASASAAADAERRAREAEERAKKALEARRTARLGRQFTALGLTAEGQQRVPGAGSLRTRLASLRRQVEGTVLDTPKTAAQLDRISNVLSGKFGKVGRDVRSAILDMFRDITGALKDGAKETENATVTSFQKRGVGKILAGLGLSPQEIKALRQRLAQGGVGGFAPRAGLGGAFGVGVGAGGNVIVNGNLIVQNPRDVDQFVKEVQRKGNRSSGSRRGTRPGVNRGLS